MYDFHTTSIILHGGAGILSLGKIVRAFEFFNFLPRLNDEKKMIRYRYGKEKFTSNVDNPELAYSEEVSLNFYKKDKQSFEADVYFKKQHNEWYMDINRPLDPSISYDECIISDNYEYRDIMSVYNLTKCLHVITESQITAGCKQSAWADFGDYEGTHYGYDSIVRFDNKGRCRLIRPYEESRKVTQKDLETKEIDGKVVANWCVDTEESVEINVSGEFLQSINSDCGRYW